MLHKNSSGAARDSSPRVSFQCGLSYGVRTPPCAIVCIYICAHIKDPVVHVRVRWIIIIITYHLTASVVGSPQMISQPVSPFFPVLHCPLGLAELQACPFPGVVFPPVRLFTIVRRSSCGPIACWILARTSWLVKWSLYEMCSILR